MPAHLLGVLPEPLEESNELTALVEQAFARVNPQAPVFRMLPDTIEPIQAFVAHTPDDAIEWICRHVSKAHLLKIIHQIYDNPRPQDGRSSLEVSDAENSHRPSKRARREPTTKQVNQRLKEQLDYALLETVASTQDVAAAKRTDITFSEEERKYRNFAKQLQKVGVSEVAEMINRAKAVAAASCLQDWKAVLQAWREMHREGKRLFPRTGTTVVALQARGDSFHSVSSAQDTACETQETPATLSQVEQRGHTDTVLTKKEVEGFRNLLASARRNETADIIGSMRHRWVMSALYAEYERLEDVLSKRAKVTSTRGRGIATVAREQLFRALLQAYHEDYARDNYTTRYRSWNRYLDYGKRWWMLRQKFGIGIFALMPKGGIPHAFVERRPIHRLEDWIQMVATCNENIQETCEAIEPLFLRCMAEEAPPEQLFLEVVEEEDIEDWSFVALLKPTEDRDRSFQNLTNEHGIPDSEDESC